MRDFGFWLLVTCSEGLTWIAARLNDVAKRANRAALACIRRAALLQDIELDGDGGVEG